MPGVPVELAEHSLHVDPKVKPVKQGLRRLNEERRKLIGEEVARLLEAGFITEVFHPKWVANPVWYKKRMGNGACALTTPISTRYVQKIPLHYLLLTK